MTQRRLLRISCGICGDIFTLSSSRRKYCSDACKKEARKERNRKNRRFLWKTQKDKLRGQNKRYYEANKEKILTHNKAYTKTPAGKRAVKRNLNKQRQKDPEKYFARKEVQKALMRGDLVKKPCRICGAKKVEAHHKDYSKPLDVIWLCRKHHEKEDKKCA